MRRSALVLSAETPSAYALVRALHEAGFDVSVFAEGRLSPAAASWRCADVRRVGRWTAADLEYEARRLRPGVVVPATEGDLVRLALVREQVEDLARVVAPPPDVLHLATDKLAALEAAAHAGVAVPDQVALDPREEVPDVPPADFPAYAKPRRSRVLLRDGAVWAGTARRLRSRADLVEAQREFAVAGLETLVQRPVPGEAVCASLLLTDGGAPSAVFVHRRVREAHPDGGPSACAVSEPPDPRVVAPAVAAARALRLFGFPAQFEFRVPHRGDPVLLDVNPRPWGTLGLALDCGVDFFGLAARHALGDPLPAPPRPYRVGVVRHYLPFEVRRALALLFHRGSPAPRGGGVLEPLLNLLYLPTDALVFRLDDPSPGVADALRLIGGRRRG